MDERLLYFLKEATGYISGEEISKSLKITRQGLWKHIQELKDLGYEIEAVPHLGYRLISVPDRLFPAEIKYKLNTKILAKKIYYFDMVGSTMDVAFELGLKNAVEGTLVLAEGQRRGRGRLNRSWYSPKYKGIYLSLILRPKVLPNRVSIFTLMSAVAVCKAIKSFTGLDARIKWPNDIIVNEKKVGGILIEVNAELDCVHFLVIGIGINVNNEKKSLMYRATSLKVEKKQTVDRIGLLKELLCQLENDYLTYQKKGSECIIEEWRKFNLTLGRIVKIVCQGNIFEGIAYNIDSDGSLLLRLDSGIIKKINTGDVIHLR